MTEKDRLADAQPRHWTAALPARLLAFAQLSRFDRPIGWRLLLLPCWMGIAVVRIEDGFWPEDALHAIAFFFGAILMRGAGCTYNDLVDRDIDAKVERTRTRPLPSGRVTKLEAWAWLAAQCALALVALFALPRLAQITAIASLPLVAVYPFMKRVTWWPQAWLGLVFSWAALVGWVEMTASLSLAGALLYAGSICWVVGYDSIYALQDREDDALVGIRSSALAMGRHVRAGVGGFYTAAVALWAGAVWCARPDPLALLALLPVALHLLWQVATLKEDGADPLQKFRSNRFAGLLMFAACVVVGAS